MAIRLPEEVINHIFSFLGPKDLIQTTLLSKRWRNFWVSVPSTALRFNVSNVYSMNFFQQFLHRRRRRGAAPTVLERLSIQWWPLCESKLFNMLIASALDHHVQDLHISLAPRSEIIICPHDLSSYALPPSILSAPNLTTLTLDQVCLDGAIPITCPDLETLILLDCGWGSRLALKTSELRSLEVVNYIDVECELELETPKLSYVSYRDEYGSLECWFGRVDEWEGVDGWFNTCRISNKLQGSNLCQVPLEWASHVRVSADGTFDVLEGTISAMGSLLKSYGNQIRSLELNTYLLNAASTTTRLASLLISSCTSVEIFVMQVGDRYQDPDTLNTEMVIELPVSCTLNKLKYVAVQGVEGFDCELEFFRLLLSSAVNLQRMIIVESASNYFNHKRRVLEQFRNTLFQQFPKARFSIQLL